MKYKVNKDVHFERTDDCSLKVGDKVLWYDPEVSARDLSRVYEVKEIKGEILLIADDYSEAEVTLNELTKV